MAPPRLHLPVWPFWLAGAACEAVCAPLGIEPPIYRRRVDFFTKSRAFDISAPARELGYAPAVGLRDGIRQEDARTWLPAGHDGSSNAGSRKLNAGSCDARSRSDVHPARTGPALRPGRRRARSTRRSSSASPAGRAPLARVRALLSQNVARRARASRCARRSIRRCSAPAAATSSSARTSCSGIRTRSGSATTW